MDFLVMKNGIDRALYGMLKLSGENSFIQTNEIDIQAELLSDLRCGVSQDDSRGLPDRVIDYVMPKKSIFMSVCAAV